MITVLVIENLLFTFAQALHLGGQTLNGLLQALLAASQRLHFQLQLMGFVLMLTRFHARPLQQLLHAVTFGLQTLTLVGIVIDGTHCFLPGQAQLFQRFALQRLLLTGFSNVLIEFVGAQRKLLSTCLFSGQLRF